MTAKLRSLILGLAPLASIGCAAGPATAPAPTPGREPVAEIHAEVPGAPALSPPIERPGQRDAAASSPQAPDDGGAPTSAEERMRVLEREMSVREQEAEFVIRSYLEDARRLRAENRPEAAIRACKDGLAVRGAAAGSAARQEAEELLYEIERSLGRLQGALETTTKSTVCGVPIKPHEARKEAQTLLARAKALYSAKDYPDAIEAFERVLEIVRWAPGALDLNGYPEQARAYIRSAKDLQEGEALSRLRRASGGPR